MSGPLVLVAGPVADPGRDQGGIVSTYAWVIDIDHLADDGAEPGSLAENAATITGPSDAPDELLAKLAAGEGDEFRMYDDDGELYYSGRLMSTDGWDGEDGFGPLDDLGRPNAGAVIIKYKVGAVWKTL